MDDHELRMSGLLSASLAEARDRSQYSDTQLVLLLGTSPTALAAAAEQAADETGWPLVDLNLAIAQDLVELTPSERPDEAWDALERAVDAHEGAVVLGSTDILFEPTLGYRPYEALRRLGRRKPIIAVWLGTVEGSDIVRSAPGHPEYTRVRLDVPFVAVPSKGEHA